MTDTPPLSSPSDPGSASSGGAPADVEITPLDLTHEAVESSAAVGMTAVDEMREDTRKTIAISLLAMLGVICLAWTAVGIWGDQGDATGAGNALDKIFTGILGLTGTAVGFYFGSGGSSGTGSGGAGTRKR